MYINVYIFVKEDEKIGSDLRRRRSFKLLISVDPLWHRRGGGGGCHVRQEREEGGKGGQHPLSLQKSRPASFIRNYHIKSQEFRLQPNSFDIT